MKPVSFTKVAIQKFAELKDQRGVQFMAARTTQLQHNLLIAKGANGEEVMLLVDDQNLQAFAMEILRGTGIENN